MRWIGISVLLAAACAASPTKLVERAVEASGGEEALKGVHSYHIASDGTWAGEPYSVLKHLRDRSDWRWDMKSESMGEWSMWVLGEDEATYSRAGGRTYAQTGPQRDEALAHKRVESSIYLPDRLLAPDVTLEKSEPVKIGSYTCPAVKARFGDSTPVIYAFDPDTHRIRQVQFTARGPDGKEATAVLELGDWEDVGGIQVAKRNHMSWGTGKSRATMHEEITVVKWNPDPMPAGILAIPVVDPLPERGIKTVPETLVAQFTFEGPFNKTGEGVAQVMTWVTQNGGQPAGNISLIYPEMGVMKTIIQLPVKMEARPKGGAVKLMRRRAFEFAYANWEGMPGGSMNLMGHVSNWCTQEGYTPTGHIRIEWIQPPNAEGIVVSQIGLPVRK